MTHDQAARVQAAFAEQGVSTPNQAWILERIADGERSGDGTSSEADIECAFDHVLGEVEA